MGAGVAAGRTVEVPTFRYTTARVILAVSVTSGASLGVCGLIERYTVGFYNQNRLQTPDTSVKDIQAAHDTYDSNRDKMDILWNLGLGALECNPRANQP